MSSLKLAALAFQILLGILQWMQRNGVLNDGARQALGAFYVELAGLIDHDKQIRERVAGLSDDDFGRLLDRLGDLAAAPPKPK